MAHLIVSIVVQAKIKTCLLILAITIPKKNWLSLVANKLAWQITRSFLEFTNILLYIFGTKPSECPIFFTLACYYFESQDFGMPCKNWNPTNRTLGFLSLLGCPRPVVKAPCHCLRPSRHPRGEKHRELPVTAAHCT